MAYLLDADVFIRAKNLHYGLDFCPAFWDWIIAGNVARAVFSVEKVGDEVQAVADELSEWAAALGPGFFLPPDATVFPALAAVSTWASWTTVRTISSQHISAGSRLLPRGSCVSRQVYGCNT
jgi:hypothetical protein